MQLWFSASVPAGGGGARGAAGSRSSSSEACRPSAIRRTVSERRGRSGSSTQACLHLHAHICGCMLHARMLATSRKVQGNGCFALEQGFHDWSRQSSLPCLGPAQAHCML
jgi:hypothetical protein